MPLSPARRALLIHLETLIGDCYNRNTRMGRSRMMLGACSTTSFDSATAKTLRLSKRSAPR
jgi:hypothetical protein